MKSSIFSLLDNNSNLHVKLKVTEQNTITGTEFLHQPRCSIIACLDYLQIKITPSHSLLQNNVL